MSKLDKIYEDNILTTHDWVNKSQMTDDIKNLFRQLVIDSIDEEGDTLEVLRRKIGEL